MQHIKIVNVFLEFNGKVDGKFSVYIKMVVFKACIGKAISGILQSAVDT